MGDYEAETSLSMADINGRILRRTLDRKFETSLGYAIDTRTLGGDGDSRVDMSVPMGLGLRRNSSEKCAWKVDRWTRLEQS